MKKLVCVQCSHLSVVLRVVNVLLEQTNGRTISTFLDRFGNAKVFVEVHVEASTDLPNIIEADRFEGITKNGTE